MIVAASLFDPCGLAKPTVPPNIRPFVLCAIAVQESIAAITPIAITIFFIWSPLCGLFQNVSAPHRAHALSGIMAGIVLRQNPLPDRESRIVVSRRQLC